jgi:hypothetical protein
MPDDFHGSQLIDGNAVKVPHCPLEPAIQAVSVMASSKVKFSALDFILDRNTLRKLYGMSNGERKAFRIDGELVGDKTVMLTRVDEKLFDRYDGFHGFGDNFFDSQTREANGFTPGAFGGAYWRVSK